MVNGNNGLDSSEIELEQIKKQLEIARAELKIVAGASGRAIRVVNKDFSVRRINQAFAELFGVDTEEAVGKKCWTISG
jgi:PAS domain S-box-containing protein